VTEPLSPERRPDANEGSIDRSAEDSSPEQYRAPSYRPGNDADEEIQGSTPGSSGPDRAAGGMGVSSERVGRAGPGQEATDGLRDVAPHERDPHADVPPEQSTGNPEPHPQGLPPKAGYSAADPRADDET
jgi:hypothetical protein